MIEGILYDGLKVDMWSIGVIMFRMAFGIFPFGEDDNDDLDARILLKQIEPVDKLRNKMST